MDEKKLEVLDFKVTDLVSHINTATGKEMQLRAESRVNARTPDPGDGTVYIFLNVKIHDGEEGNFLFDITTTTVLQLPDGMTDVSDDDAPACISVAQAQTNTAIRNLTENMGMVPLELGDSK